MSTHWTERLSEYVDGELSAAEAATCEAHLASCDQCRVVASDLRALVAVAKSDVDQLPAIDLWPGVLARIAPANRLRQGYGESAEALRAKAEAAARSQEAAGQVVAFNQRARAYTFTLPQLALAASLLIAVSAGVAYLAAGRAVSPSPVIGEAPIQAQAEPLLPASATVERANFADEQYYQAVADLEKVLVDTRDELDPRTVVVIERNLATIDEAIREARAALDADPANTFLNSHLVDARRKKLELLRRATMIHSTSGD